MEETAATTNATTSSSTHVYVRHCDPNLTGEGLGSHARGSVCPLLRVSLAFGWEILWHHASGAFGKENQTRPFYEEECRHLGEWLLLDGDDGDGDNARHDTDDADKYHERTVPHGQNKLTTFDDLDRNRLMVVNIDLENDPRLGRILGYAGIIISSIEAFIEEHDKEAFYNQPSKSKTQEQPQQIVLVSLNGRFQYQDDPSPTVVQWLQTKGQTWRRQQIHQRKRQSSSQILKVAVHVRVPEDYCSQKWKDANDISHVSDALEVLKE